MGVQATEWVHMHSSMCRMCYCAHAVKTSRGLCIIPGTTEAAFLISSLTSARATFGGSVSRGASSAAAVRRLMDEEMSKRIPIFRGRFPAAETAPRASEIARINFSNARANGNRRQQKSRRKIAGGEVQTREVQPASVQYMYAVCINQPTERDSCGTDYCCWLCAWLRARVTKERVEWVESG